LEALFVDNAINKNFWGMQFNPQHVSLFPSHGKDLAVCRKITVGQICRGNELIFSSLFLLFFVLFPIITSP
jgi:hypothetical protein